MVSPPSESVQAPVLPEFLKDEEILFCKAKVMAMVMLGREGGGGATPSSCFPSFLDWFLYFCFLIHVVQASL